ncbi:acetolactate synthase small subunit [Bacillus badius]|uniref:Acetolactate synthase small subunit n=1 Tax=Bacillus badius TaxID=1455 RepID=A0ABR5ASC6_BACBA|nr:acetolactate synthase small subunit [Bacillus badius]KIL73020.1 Acetolactate synthase small subunit [Bacillus badius]KIL77564.1 Acetolactate synthase small subunit [Bacillus badius]KZO01151.1 acetolactate synthase small subunit [Bacillus badius]KZR59024.1 acetolactate synthase small subunit [Bacillus badius]MED0667703.1 acetolactate synthase small subunit [Bacillus badius]
MKRTVTVTVLNQSGVLNRITGLFTKRQFNIESITVGPTETEGISKMTVIVHVEDERVAEQVLKQLNKQVDVLKVTDITDQAVVSRELALIKVLTTPQTRAEINVIIEPFRATIIDVAKDSVTIQVVGNFEKIEAMIELLRPYGIKELSRTGQTALTRGSQKQVTDLKQYSILK